jgi:hypothetical protein
MGFTDSQAFAFGSEVGRSVVVGFADFWAFAFGSEVGRSVIVGVTDFWAFAFGSEVVRSVLLTTIEFEDVVRWLFDTAWDLCECIWLIKSLNVV